MVRTKRTPLAIVPMIAGLAACGGSAVQPDDVIGLPDTARRDPPFDAGIVTCPRVDTSAALVPAAFVSTAAIPSVPDGGVIVPDGTYSLSAVITYGLGDERPSYLAEEERSVFDLHDGSMHLSYVSPYRQSLSGTYSNASGVTVFHVDCPGAESFPPPIALTPTGFAEVILVNNGTGAVVYEYARQ